MKPIKLAICVIALLTVGTVLAEEVKTVTGRVTAVDRQENVLTVKEQGTRVEHRYKVSADARISMVLHGRATLDALNDDAWASRFGGDGNPNLDCLQQLHHAGVEILVCGQSLLGQDGKPEDLVVFADVAVSALTALVNHQADGYAIVQIGPK